MSFGPGQLITSVGSQLAPTPLGPTPAQAGGGGGGSGGGSDVTVVTNPNPGAQRTDIFDATIANAGGGPAVVTSASGGFAKAVVGQVIKVAGAGAAGTVSFVDTIASIQGNGQVTCASQASTNVAGVQCSYGLDWTGVILAAVTSAVPDAIIRVPAGTDFMVTTLPPFPGTYDWTGATFVQATNQNVAVASNSIGTSDRPVTVRWHAIGGIQIGDGFERQNGAWANVTNIQDLLFRDNIQLGVQAYFGEFTDCQRQRVQNITVSTTGNPLGAQNYIAVFYTTNGTAGNAPQDCIISENMVLAPNGQSDAFGITSSNTTNSNQAFPVNLIVVSNDFTSRSTPIGAECGGTGGSVFYLQRYVIANNLVNCTRQTSSRAIYLRDDSTTGSTDPLLMTDGLVVCNVIYTQCGAIEVQTQRGITALNSIRVAFASSSDVIAVTNHGPRTSQHLVALNHISLLDGVTGIVIHFFGVNQSSALLNTIVYDTGASGAADAIMLQNCSDCDTFSNTFRNLPGRAVRCSNCTGVTQCIADKIYNPCIASGNASFFLDSGLGGGIIYIKDSIHHGGIPSPGLPGLSASGAGSTLGAGTYLAKVSYVNPAGETLAGTEGSITIAAGQNIVVSSPPQVGNASGFRIYLTAVGGLTNTETLQGVTNPIGTPVTLTAQAAGAALPGANTTSKISFCINNQGTNATVKGANNSPLAGIGTGNTNGAYSALTLF